MKKILLIGKFNTVFSDINNYLTNYFKIQVCVDNLEMVKGMAKLYQPDLVILSLIGMSEGEREIFAELSYNHPQLPVICIGTVSEQVYYFDFIKMEQFTMLTRPVANEKILKTIYDLLNVDSNTDESKDEIEERQKSKKSSAIMELEQIQKAEEGQENENNQQNARKCVLLVDDNVFQLRTLKAVLEKQYDVQLATSGMKALTLIGKRVPDIIFLDYEMPMCDGKMTLQMIREIEEAKDVPIVFLTGVKDKENIQAVLELHPAGYLLKPPSMEKIFETIESLLT